MSDMNAETVAAVEMAREMYGQYQTDRAGAALLACLRLAGAVQVDDVLAAYGTACNSIPEGEQRRALAVGMAKAALAARGLPFGKIRSLGRTGGTGPAAAFAWLDMES